MLTNSANYQVLLLLHIYHSTVFLFPQGFERMLKIQKHSVEEEFVDKAEANAEPEIYSEVASTVLRMQDAEVQLTAEAGGPLSVGSWTPIACTCDRKLQNRKLH
jgi:hypothetical protein